MHSVGSVPEAAIPWDIAVAPARIAGVEMAGFIQGTNDPLDIDVIPYPAVTLVVDIGGEIGLEDSGGAFRRGSVVIGQAPGGVRGRGRGFECLQVRLSPVVAYAILGTPLHENPVLSLDDLWGYECARFEERLRMTSSWRERFAIVEATLARRYDERRAVDPEVAFAWGRLVASDGQIRVEQLASESGWSRKRLWSRFRSQVGLTPKHAARLIRFDRAVHRLAAGSAPTQVASDFGYADQSHLHRDVLAFAGLTPTTVATAPWLAVDDVAWPARDQAAGTVSPRSRH